MKIFQEHTGKTTRFNLLNNILPVTVQNIEIMKMDSFEIGRNVEQVSAHNLRDLPDSGPKSIPVPVTQVYIGVKFWCY